MGTKFACFIQENGINSNGDFENLPTVQWKFKSNGPMFSSPESDDTFRDDIMNFIKTPADFIGMEYTLGAIFFNASHLE